MHSYRTVRQLVARMTVRQLVARMTVRQSHAQTVGMEVKLHIDKHFAIRTRDV
jgi:hypothetical protein